MGQEEDLRRQELKLYRMLRIFLTITFGHMKYRNSVQKQMVLIKVYTGLLVNDPTLQFSQRAQSEYTDKVRGTAAAF